MPQKASKAQAALQLKQKLECDRLVVFGDGKNDIDMFEYTKISFAMGNAEDDVKKAADYVTDDIDEDGLYNALKYFEII